MLTLQDIGEIVILVVVVVGMVWGLYEVLAFLGEWAYTTFIEDFVKETIREILNEQK